MSIISPLASGSLIGLSDIGFASWPGGVGLCFNKKSRRAPRENDAIDGRGPRKRSSSLW